MHLINFGRRANGHLCELIAFSRACCVEWTSTACPCRGISPQKTTAAKQNRHAHFASVRCITQWSTRTTSMSAIGAGTVRAKRTARCVLRVYLYLRANGFFVQKGVFAIGIFSVVLSLLFILIDLLSIFFDPLSLADYASAVFVVFGASFSSAFGTIGLSSSLRAVSNLRSA